MRPWRLFPVFLFLTILVPGGVSFATGNVHGAASFLSGTAYQSLEVCETFTVDIVSASGSFLFCPASTGPVSFSAEASYQEEGIPFDPQNFNYHWSVDGISHSGMQISHTFVQPGAYPVRLTVEDPLNGCTAS
ncbi:MAG: PKD domain-containing protein, partial [Bacteroidales bacterium]